MKDRLGFDNTGYKIKTCRIEERSITYRAFEGLDYCANPLSTIQKLNIFVPEKYFTEEAKDAYRLTTAPIFMPNTVGGYMPGPADGPGQDRFGFPNAIFEALDHGYVVASAGVRGRTSGISSTEFYEGSKEDFLGENTGKMVGRAPAFIVDMKAAIRYLRHNKAVMYGDTERIVTSGTSAGGALSALTGATGNSSDYEVYLKEIGAAEERDDIFAANCYCPIHNLEHADAAYEWQFCGEHAFYRTRHEKNGDGTISRVPFNGTMTEEQEILSRELKALFPAYLNSLKLTTAEGESLTLDEAGEGSFQKLVESYVIASAQKELDTANTAKHLDWLAVCGSDVEKQEALTIEDGKVTGLDWKRYIQTITRMKAAPAFDALDLQSPENDEFGTRTIAAKHFTKFSYEHSHADGELAEDAVIKMMNPVRYIDAADESTIAKHWRIRHGAYDRDTSLAIPTILATLLKNRGYEVDYALPWGLPHSGDYDLAELFAWIDERCEDMK